MNQPWKIEDGLKLIRALQARIRTFGYQMTLGGDVLHNNEGSKLELFFLPFNDPSIAKDDSVGLVQWLTSLWGEPEYLISTPDNPPAPEWRMNAVVNADGPVMPRPVVRVNDDEPMAAPGILNESPQEAMRRYVMNAPKKKTNSYKNKLTFQRTDDRVDVYVV